LERHETRIQCVVNSRFQYVRQASGGSPIVIINPALTVNTVLVLLM
jgi:hypothetical protein